MASRNMKMTDAVQQLKAHWNDLANRCVRDNRPYFTDFLPAEDTAMAEAIANTAGAVCTAWGGTENTTRVILCFAPDFIPVTPEQFPIQCLTFSYRVPKPPTHRNFLGACMACNLERDTIGDILIDTKMAQMFVCAHVAPVLLQEVHQIGRVGVSVTGDDPVCLSVQMDFLLIQGTIASLRADAVAALATRLSREKAVQLIRQGRLTYRHATIDTPSAVMQVGDVFSIRGYGKFRIAAVDGISRKGRYHITIQKYQG